MLGDDIVYTSGYNRLFWGIIFITFHINLGNISIPPSFIGYILIYSGLNILESQQQIYKKGKLPAALLTLLTIKDVWYNQDSNILANGFQNLELPTLIIGQITLLMDLYLIYIIFSGIYELCSERGLEEFSQSVKNCWKFCFAVFSISLFCAPFLINLPNDFSIFLIIVILFQIIAYISISIIFRKCRITFEN